MARTAVLGLPRIGAERDRPFELDASHWTGPLREAAALGIATRPVVLGPFSFLALSKGAKRSLEELVPIYEQLLRELAEAGAAEVQLDEPCLALDRTARELDAVADAWTALARAPVELCLATYFAPADPRVFELGADEVHVDLVRAPEQLQTALNTAGRLSLGVLDGRNVWAADLDQALDRIDAAVAALGSDRVTIAPSCSLLHVPYEAARETSIEVRPWLALAVEKLAELGVLKAALDGDRDALLEPAREVISSRRTSALTNDPEVRRRAAGRYERDARYEVRREAQRARFALPELPTTTIGSFPQTPEIRAARTQPDYERFLERTIAEVISHQEHVGLDVLVHGEPERKDMVEHFGERLRGFAFSEHGWVQSYGSRCVKPPILYGDVSRPEPMTVRAETQIHTHMCYSEFNEIMEHIVRLDADVLSIEASRSGMEVLEGLDYPNEIGPGVYDIHSPRVPSIDEIERLLELAEERVGRERLWVNPDCGLKTRGWNEVRPALANMVAAAHRRRAAVRV